MKCVKTPGQEPGSFILDITFTCAGCDVCDPHKENQ